MKNLTLKGINFNLDVSIENDTKDDDDISSPLKWRKKRRKRMKRTLYRFYNPFTIDDEARQDEKKKKERKIGKAFRATKRWKMIHNWCEGEKLLLTFNAEVTSEK